jgi:citrate lyase beta subunit
MIESFFFIPGNHPKLIEKLETIQADHFIIDLEDSVSKDLLNISVEAVSKIKEKEKLWVRPLLFENEKFKPDLLQRLLNLGFTHFVIPKIRSRIHVWHLEEAIKTRGFKNCFIILLVENPECLLNLSELIKQTNLKITGIGFGSQDYCTETGMKHSPEYLRQPRFIISNTAKALGLKSIDIACMDTAGGEIFKDELQEAVNLGYEGKFIIHPKQLEALKNFPFYKQEEVDQANQILMAYEEKGRPAVFIYDGKAIEPPHIRHYLKIKKWGERNGKK